MTPTIVNRKKKCEMDQAIKDLEARGYKVIYGPIEQKRDGKAFNYDDIGRTVFQRNTFSSSWIAKLVRV